MAKFESVVMKKGDVVREASTPAAYNQLVWDGYQPSELKKDAKAAGVAPPLKPAASGGTAAGEKTVGTNPS